VLGSPHPLPSPLDPSASLPTVAETPTHPIPWRNLYDLYGYNSPGRQIIQSGQSAQSAQSAMTRPIKPSARTRATPSRRHRPDPRESLRRSFRPKRVKILFIGESPPASGRFFYQADSGLYRAFRDAFLEAFPNLPEANFLHSFQSLGCYLVDLCPQPVDRLPRAARTKAHRLGERALAATLRQLRPAAIVTFLRSIAPSTLRAQKAARYSGPSVILPYPGRWQRHRTTFLQALIPLLRQHLTHHRRAVPEPVAHPVQG